MSFLLPLALLIFVSAVGPLVAHALRRGKTQTIDFPAARLVPKVAATTKQRSRLEDRLLLAVRLLLLLLLALLGATPFVSCSRLSLARPEGASVGAVIIVDDSASMRVLQAGKTRLALARDGARQLLESARAGDTFAVVAAGKPARLVLPPTSDFSQVRRAIDELQASDRPTDLSAALSLGQSIRESLVQEAGELVVLSDFADAAPSAELAFVAPLDELRTPFENCALLQAEQSAGMVTAGLRCTSPTALSGRTLRLLNQQGEVLAEAEAEEFVSLAPQDLPAQPLRIQLSAVSTQQDQIPQDDEVDVLREGEGFLVALRVDPDRAAVSTSKSNIVKSALEALESGAEFRHLSLMPSSESELGSFAALLVDDPPGFTPETQTALQRWVRSGGVALLLLGPGLQKAPLGSGFSPFLDAAPTWEQAPESGFQGSEGPGSLGPLSSSWHDLAAQGRAQLPFADKQVPLAAFSDGEPLIVQRSLGEGLLITSALPSSVDLSDLALRPAYLDLLSHLLREARLRHGESSASVGTPWRATANSKVTGPAGELPLLRQGGDLVVEPDLAGAYRFENDGKISTRFALRDPEESVRQPQALPSGTRASGLAKKSQATEISKEIALILLSLVLLELFLRLRARHAAQEERAAPSA